MRLIAVLRACCKNASRRAILCQNWLSVCSPAITTGRKTSLPPIFRRPARHPVFLLHVAIFCMIVLLPLAPGAAGEDELSEKARMLMEYQSFMRGDRDGGVRFFISASRDMQGTPLAELAVRIAMFYDPAELSNVNVGEVEARRILSAESELSLEHRDILRRFVARSFAAAGRREDAMEVHRRRGLAMSWLLAGPFSGRKGAGFESRDLPEGGEIAYRDVFDELPDGGGFRQWRKTPPWRPIPENRSFPFVRPWKGTGRSDDGSMLMFSCVEVSDADNKSSFHVLSDTSWRLYVDGALLAEVDRNSRESPVEHMVPYSMAPGRHTVIFQVFPPPLGVDREKIRVALRLESTAVVSWNRDAEKPAPARTVNARREARPLRSLQELGREAENRPVLMSAYALACLEQKMPDTAAWWGEAAARMQPKNASLQFIAGLTTSLNPLLPEGRRRDIASSWHRNTLTEKPDVVPSLLFMARIASGVGKAREAAGYLERAYAVNPVSLDVLLARAEWARTFASGGTARAAWDECARVFPNSPAVQIAIASMPYDGFLDMERRLAACRAAAESAPYMAETSLKLAEALADSGNNQEAEFVLRSALEQFAGDAGVLASIANVYARLGLYEDAIRILSGAIRITPDNDAMWRRLGDFHMDSGDQPGAERFWRVSLAANPGQFQLSDMMDYLAGSPTRLSRSGGYDAIALTATADRELYSGDVVRLLDRSVISFLPDGSYRRLTHEIDLARTRRGGESLTGIDESGELLTARIVFPNGNTLEPEPYPGQGGLRLPVIMPGASREVRVLESVHADGGIPEVQPWFFQDPSGKMPLLMSEYVIRTPRNFPLVYAVRNLGNTVDFDFSQEEDVDIYKWTANLSLPSREPDAVHISERVPSVEIGMKTTWDDVVFHELRKLEGKTIPSMRIRAVLANLYQQQPGGSPNPLQAARAIYRYVCDNIDPSPAGNSAAHIHVDRMGDRSLLLLAMLRAAGMDAAPAFARPSAQFMHPPTWELPSRDIFTVPMVRLVIPGGGTYWLDVRFDSLPFGKITDDLSGATLLAFLPNGPLFETLPSLPAEDSISYKERSIKLPAGEEGVEVSGRSLRRGVSGLARDRDLAEADADARKTMLLTSIYPVFPDAVLRQFDAQRTDDTEASSLERYEITARSSIEMRPDGVRAISLCLLPLQVISSETRNLTQRRTACHVKAVHMAEDHNVFRLPEGGSFVRLPEPAHIPSRFGVYQLRILPQGETAVEVVRNYHIPAQRIMPWDWSEFLSFLEKVDLAEKQWFEYVVED